MGDRIANPAPAPSLQSPNQIPNPHVKRIGQDLERLKHDVALAALNRSHVCPVQPCMNLGEPDKQAGHLPRFRIP